MKRFSSLCCILFFAFISVNLAVDAPSLKLEDVLNRFKSGDARPIPFDNGSETQDTPTIAIKKKTREVKELIARIEITGNESVPLAVIQSEVFIKPGDTFHPFKVTRVIKNILSLGLFENVEPTVIDTADGKVLTFNVIENPSIGDIRFEGNAAIGRRELLDRLQSQEGDILNKTIIRDDIQAIKSAYNEAGFFQFTLRRIELPKNDGDPLTFIMDEGVITHIEVTGNLKTQSIVITREMSLEKGDVLQSDELREDVRRIFNLNYFTGIEPKVKRNDTGYTLVMDVTERETNGQFSFGGGYSPQGGFSLFSDLFWDNLFGTGQLILLKGQFNLGGNESRGNTYQFKYHNPWMWDKRRSFTFRAWDTNGSFRTVPIAGTDTGDFQDERRLGIEAAIGLPHGYDLRSIHKLKFEGVILEEFDRGYNVNSYTFGLIWDTRDVRFNPREGSYYTFFVEKGFDFTDTTLDFTRFDLEFRQFIPTFEKQTLALRLDLGYLTSPELDDVEIFSGEYYRVGFNDTVRSQNENNFIFGNKQIVSSVEYRFLFNDTFSAVIFLDAGIASNQTFSEWDVANLVQIGKGVGIRFLIPGLGPLRLDAGSDESGTVRIQVNIGHAF